MQFEEGARVVTSEGEKVGTIDRVVLDPESKEVTHIVVKKGFLFTEDKVVPMNLVGPTTPDRVTLRENETALEQLPDFRERSYVPAVDDEVQTESGQGTPARFLYLYPPVGAWWMGREYTGYTQPKYVVKTTTNIPEGTVALEEGARVVASDGNTLGEVERILTDPTEERATHILISKGLFLKEGKLIPTGWIADISEGELRLSVTSSLVEQLPEFQPAH